MKRLLGWLFISIFCGTRILTSQDLMDAEVFLLTCGPGTETYSIYGHSAVRIVIPSKNIDQVYNWGVFDFSTPNFAWKFAKGRLEYMLGTYSYESFLREYQYEKRWVISQKINLEDNEKNTLFKLISENLRPENIKYRYDFFYDNCSTRIRDLLEKATGENLIYPDDEIKKNMPTFRELISVYQKGYPWLNFGIDLLLGAPCDKKASFRDRMFLPLELQKGLSSLVVRRNGKMIPLLSNPITELAYNEPLIKESLFGSPIFIFSLVIIGFIILSGAIRGNTPNRLIDIFIFSIFSLLAVLMIFSNFFTDHQQLRWNLNIIWLNPFLFICLYALIFNKKNKIIWFRMTFWLGILFLVQAAISPQQFNNAVYPLTGLIILRSSVRAGFGWNPLSLTDLT